MKEIFSHFRCYKTGKKEYNLIGLVVHFQIYGTDKVVSINPDLKKWIFKKNA